MDVEKLDECQKVIGYRFREIWLLEKALTHSSRRSSLLFSNERLEFLGDAVLGLAISDYIFRKFPKYREGELTKIKSVVVSRLTLAKVAKKLGLGSYLSVGRGISNRRSLPASLLADLFEAIIAAIYIDGGLYPATEFVLRNLLEEIDRVNRNQHSKNYKSLLQQFSQKELGATPTYRLLEEAGADHQKSFHVVAVIAGRECRSAWGVNKRQAEQRAAEDTLKMLMDELNQGKQEEQEAEEVADVQAENETEMDLSMASDDCSDSGNDNEETQPDVNP